MKQKLLAICLCLLATLQMVYAQNTALPDNNATISSYYQLALKYKNGEGSVAPDYTKAYQYFSAAAALGDEQSIYAVGYLTYKGLGCTQDYTAAAKLFARGAFQGRDNSMYFYALCWRNGYGVVKNGDSAKYYLNKAIALNYKQAALELQAINEENSNDSAASILVQQLHNAAIIDKAVFNKFSKITPHLPSARVIAGNYSGWILQYDWSGEHIVSSKKLQLTIDNRNEQVFGQWIEEGIDTTSIKAILTNDAIVFKETKYKRRDHYSADNAIAYTFDNAKLNLVQAGDSVFIAGTVDMFSPQRGEPSKPLFIALARASNTENLITTASIKVYPNPFSNSLAVEFTITDNEGIEVQLQTIGGAVIYKNDGGKLTTGTYRLPIQTTNLAAGAYLLKLTKGNISSTIKVIKQ